jgi:hypothetical protein
MSDVEFEAGKRDGREWMFAGIKKGWSLKDAADQRKAKMKELTGNDGFQSRSAEGFVQGAEEALSTIWPL